MDIQELFLKLTSKTYPHGYESELVPFLPSDHFRDLYGNYYYLIGNTRTAFTCHLDTVSNVRVDVNHKVSDGKVGTDGKSILGADDKAGMVVLLYMIEKKVPGLYCFFIGEESGCIGSSQANNLNMFCEIDRMISFDRRGTKSIITHQSGKRCCSNSFAESVSNQYKKNGMDMILDDGGVYTDSAEFVKTISECTNISVGYYNEHTTSEYQDINHLIRICLTSSKVNWETLPTIRDKSIVEYKNYYHNTYNHDFYTPKSDHRNRKRYSDPRFGLDWRQDEYYSYKVKDRTQKKSSDVNYYESLKYTLWEDQIPELEIPNIRRLLSESF